MEIKILHLIDGAKQAKGLTVIIDVFRAFSVACYVADKQPAKIIPVGDLNRAFQLKQQLTNSVLIGERDEIMPQGFDFCNSPYQIINANLKDKTIIHTTSSGTQGIANATNANEIITGSFVNAEAIIKYIQSKNPQFVSLVCMGYRCQKPSDEDTFLAEYLKTNLEGGTYPFTPKIEVLRQGAGARFFNPSTQITSPQQDFDLCLSLNRFNFVLLVQEKDGLPYLKRLNMPY